MLLMHRRGCNMHVIFTDVRVKNQVRHLQIYSGVQRKYCTVDFAVNLQDFVLQCIQIHPDCVPYYNQLE